MTIDEAIKLMYDESSYGRDYHCQIAEWLEDYKRIKMLIPIEQALKTEYNKAIDDFIHECDKYCGFYSGDNKNLTREAMLSIAEQLKAGGENVNTESES